MKKRIRRVLMGLLALAMVLTSFVGCGVPSEQTVTTTTQSASATAAGTDNPNLTPWGYDKTKIYTIKTMATPSEYYKKFSETAVGKVILDKFGIDLEAIPFAEDKTQKAYLLLASGEYYDVQPVYGIQMLQDYVAAGAAIPFDDYLDKMPNFQRVYERLIPLWRADSEDGKLYKWEWSVPNESPDNIAFNADTIRADALELYAAKYGWDNPPMFTDEYIEVLRMAKEAGLTDLNGNPVTGYSIPEAESWRLSMNIDNVSRYVRISGTQIYFDREENKLVGSYETYVSRELNRFYNTLYNEGLLDEECFTDKQDHLLDKYKQAKPIIVRYVGNWDVNVVNEGIRAAGQPEKQYVVTQPQILATEREAAMKKQLKWNVLFTNRDRGAVITKNSKEPGRILELIEWLCSDEGARISGSGIEGEDWEYVNGVPVEIQTSVDKQNADPKYKALRGINDLSRFSFPQFNILLSDGEYRVLTNSIEYKKRQSNPNDITSQYLKKYNRAYDREWIVDHTTQIKASRAMPAVKLEGTLQDISTDMTNIFNRYQYELWTCKPSDFDKKYDEFLEAFRKLKPEKVIEYYTEAYAAAYPNWYDIMNGK